MSLEQAIVRLGLCMINLWMHVDKQLWSFHTSSVLIPSIYDS